LCVFDPFLAVVSVILVAKALEIEVPILVLLTTVRAGVSIMRFNEEPLLVESGLPIVGALWPGALQCVDSAHVDKTMEKRRR